jgi:hypothetical protein
MFTMKWEEVEEEEIDEGKKGPEISRMSRRMYDLDNFIE